MSEEMKSQGSVTGSDADCGSDYSDDDDDDDMDAYYGESDHGIDYESKEKEDPEYFAYELLRVEGVEMLLNESVEAVCKQIKESPSLAKQLLCICKWDVTDVIHKHRSGSQNLLVDCRLAPKVKATESSRNSTCPVCMMPASHLFGANCGHKFCRECWQMHFQVQIQNGVSTGLACMSQKCDILVPEDFVLGQLINGKLRDKYQMFSFSDHVESHPELRFCPGPNCPMVVRALQLKAKRVICSECATNFCFKCGIDYHAPTECDVIKKWLTKCADDSETANYISAHTKDCPKCHVCIEKSGGCNHMQCTKCKHDFCWMCVGDWKTHGSEYYECSRYKENPNIVNESAHAQAREALKKYLFYFERYENHAKSLNLEEQTLQKIKSRIRDKVMDQSGTWIDWQYLLEAAMLLKKCRYTLQYTYPYAYYLEKGSRKSLFEYQQAQLEAEVENLSWKVERAEKADRGDLENQMDICEKRRLTLVRDFLTES